MPRFACPTMRENPPLCIFSWRPRQAGGIALAMIATLLVVAATTLAIRMAKQVEEKTAQQQFMLQRMERIAKSLHAYWLVHGCTLPAGALGSAVTGDAAPGGTTVPWRTLGLAYDDALDAWGRKIGYQSPGTVAQFGAPAQPQTWVLISHGPTGLGAWIANGQQMPLPANVDELANVSGGAFQLKNENAGPEVPPAGLFDDFLLWGTLDPADCTAVVTGDLIKKLLQDPNAINTKGNGSGLTAIDLVTTDLGTVRISSAGGEISTDGAYQALGVCSSGCGAGNSNARALDSSESLSFRLGTGKTAQGFALGLLGISNTTVAVSMTFKKNGVTLGNLIQSVAVNTSMPLSPQLTNLSLAPPGTQFDEVVVQPVGTSRFFVANVYFCQAAACPS